MQTENTAGPLDGVRVIEVAGQGPGPFACMLLSDLGAEVVRVERIGGPPHGAHTHGRGRRSVCVDLKAAGGADILLDLVAEAHILVEGFRPGVMERLGVGPDECLARNPALVYGRMTGWGQDGPLATVAGHDLNYLAYSGALHAIGPAGGPPVPPLNLVADYGGGGPLLALGVVAALHEAGRSGVGQVVDAAMVDGVAAMLAPFHAMTAQGHWSQERGTNMLDGGAHFYGVYRTADDKWVSVAAIEPVFYATLLRVLRLDDVDPTTQMDRSTWTPMRERLATVFASRTREEWEKEFDGHDACFHPVLDMGEARQHPHAAARGAFVEVDGAPQPAPAPRFGRSWPAAPAPSEPPGASTREFLRATGRSEEQIDALIASGVVA